MEYYVYQLIDPRDNSVFYVGKGCRNRILVHEAEAKRGVISDKCNRIREIQKDGYQVRRLFVQEYSNSSDAYDGEKRLIDELGIENLTNCMPGNIKQTDDGQSEESKTIYHFAQFIHKTHGFKLKPVIHCCGLEFDIPALLVNKIINNFMDIRQKLGHEWVSHELMKYNVVIQNNS